MQELTSPSTSAADLDRADSGSQAAVLPLNKRAAFVEELSPHGGLITAVAWSPTGGVLATAARDGVVRFLSATPKDLGGRLRLRQELATGGSKSPNALALAWHASERLLVAGCADGSVRVFRSAPPGAAAAAPAEPQWSLDATPLVVEAAATSATAAAFSPDGRWLALGSSDGSLRLWVVEQDGARLRLAHELAHAHSDVVTAIAWSPLGRQFASSSHDCTVRVWFQRDDASATGAGEFTHAPPTTPWREVHTLPHRSACDAVDWSRTSQLAVGCDGRVHVWEQTHARATSLSAASSGTTAAASAAAPAAAAATAAAVSLNSSGSGSDELPAIEEPAPLTPWSATGVFGEVGACSITPVSWSRDGRRLAAGAAAQAIRVLTRAPDSLGGDAWQIEHVLRGHRGLVTSLAWSPAVDSLASGSKDVDMKVRVWHAATQAGVWAQTQRITKHRLKVNRVVWAPAHAHHPDAEFVTASYDNKALVWRWSPGAGEFVQTGCLTSRSGDANFKMEPVLGVAWSPDRERIATVGIDRCLRFWGRTEAHWEESKHTGQSHPMMNEWRLVHTIADAHADVIRGISWSEDGSRIATSAIDRDPTIRVWRRADGRANGDEWELEQTLEGHERGVCSVAWCSASRGSAPRRSVAAARGRGRASSAAAAAANGARPVPDGALGEPLFLASASHDHSVRLWARNPINGDRWECTQVLRGHTAFVSNVAWSRDGRLASVSDDRTVRVWCRVERADASASAASRLASAVVWLAPALDLSAAVPRYQCQLVLHGHLGDVFNVSWSQHDGGRRLYSCSGDRVVREWSTESGACVRVIGGHESRVSDVAISPDGLFLATASSDKTAVVRWTAAATLPPWASSSLDDAFFTSEEERLRCVRQYAPNLPVEPVAEHGGGTLLHLLVANDDSDAVRALIRAGSNGGGYGDSMFPEDLSGMTALDVAVQHHSKAALWELLEASADSKLVRLDDRDVVVRVLPAVARVYPDLVVRLLELATLHPLGWRSSVQAEGFEVYPLEAMEQRMVPGGELVEEYGLWCRTLASLEGRPDPIAERAVQQPLAVASAAGDRARGASLVPATSGERLDRASAEASDSRAGSSGDVYDGGRPVSALVTSFPALTANWRPDTRRGSPRSWWGGFKSLVGMRSGALDAPEATEDEDAADAAALKSASRAPYHPSRPLRGESLLSVMVDLELVDGLGTDLMRTVLDYKWERFARRQFVRSFLFYVAFVLTLTTIMVAGSASAPHCGDDPIDTGEEVIGSSWAYLLLAVWAFGFTLSELVDLRHEGFRYFSDFWNVLDWLAYGLVIAMAPLRFSCDISPKAEATVSTLAAFLVWVKLLEYLRGFHKTGRFVKFMTSILRGVASFMLVFFLLQVAYVMAFFVLFRSVVPTMANESVVSKYASWQVLLTVYTTMFGSFDSEDYHESSNYGLGVALLVSYLFLVVIVLLNLLIALMSDIFGTVQENVTNEWLLERAKIVIQVERGLSSADREDYHNFPLHVHVMRPYDWETQDDTDIANRELEKRIDAKVDQLRAEVAAVASETRSLAADLRSAVSTLLEAQRSG